VRSKTYEDKAFEKSRKSQHPSGRAVAFVKCIQPLLGIPEVITTIKFIEISTKPFEQRSTTSAKLKPCGTLDRPEHEHQQDVHTMKPTSEFVRETANPPFPVLKRMTLNQLLLYRGGG